MLSCLWFFIPSCEFMLLFWFACAGSHHTKECHRTCKLRSCILFNMHLMAYISIGFVKERRIAQNVWHLSKRFMCNGWLQVVGELKTGDVCGEIGVLCYRPQVFTVRTKRLSQLLRLNRTSFLNIVKANVGDGTIIMNNLLQVCKFDTLFGFILNC